MCKAPSNPITNNLAKLDPTTRQGQTNLGLGGVVGVSGVADNALSNIDDSISGDAQRDAAREAAAQQESAALAGVELSREQFEDIQSKLDPFYQTGLGSLDQYAQLASPEGYADFQTNYLQSEPYLQKQQNVLGGLEQSSAFGGTLGSGGAALDAASYLDQYGFDQANQAYNQQLGNLGNLVGLGQFGVTGQAQASQNYTNQATAGLGRAADAQATRAIAGASPGFSPYLSLVTPAVQGYSAYQSGGATV